LLCFFADARKQVKEATERLGGEYTPHLHQRCTHLVVQISFFSFLLIFIQFWFWLQKQTWSRPSKAFL